MGLDASAAVRPREALSTFEEPTAMSTPLKVSANRDATKRCHGRAHVDPDDTNGNVVRPEN